MGNRENKKRETRQKRERRKKMKGNEKKHQRKKERRERKREEKENKIATCRRLVKPRVGFLNKVVKPLLLIIYGMEKNVCGVKYFNVYLYFIYVSKFFFPLYKSYLNLQI